METASTMPRRCNSRSNSGIEYSPTICWTRRTRVGVSLARSVLSVPHLGHQLSIGTDLQEFGVGELPRLAPQRQEPGQGVGLGEYLALGFGADGLDLLLLDRLDLYESVFVKIATIS